MLDDATRQKGEALNSFMKQSVITDNEVSDLTKKFVAKQDGLNDDCVSLSLKMKGGTRHTTLKLALDNAPDSDVIYEFRLLTGYETEQILNELSQLSYDKYDTRYSIRHTAKCLSRATQNTANRVMSAPALPEEFFLKCLDVNVLLYLGIKFAEFQHKYSPPLATLTEQDIKTLTDLIMAEYQDEKKSQALEELSLGAIFQLAYSWMNQLINLNKQMDSLFTEKSSVELQND